MHTFHLLLLLTLGGALLTGTTLAQDTDAPTPTNAPPDPAGDL